MMNGKLLLAFLILFTAFYSYAMQLKIDMAMMNNDEQELARVLSRGRKSLLDPKFLSKFLLSDHLTAGTARVLISYGANPKFKSSCSGRTGIFNACGRGDVDLVQLFLAHGLDPNEPDAFKRTAIDEAKTKDKQEVIVLLLNRAALFELIRQHRVPDVITLLRNRETFGTFNSPF